MTKEKWHAKCEVTKNIKYSIVKDHLSGVKCQDTEAKALRAELEFVMF